MRTIALALLTPVLLAGCAAGSAPEPPAVDEAAELAAIEETRNAFMDLLREKRYQDMGQVVTEDMRAVSPGSADWAAMGALAAERGTPFPYDSIVMSPMETVVINAETAWDMGTSRVYFTDAGGDVVELRDTYLAILRKGADGTWRLHREVASARVD